MVNLNHQPEEFVHLAQTHGGISHLALNLNEPDSACKLLVLKGQQSLLAALRNDFDVHAYERLGIEDYDELVALYPLVEWSRDSPELRRSCPEEVQKRLLGDANLVQEWFETFCCEW